MAKRTSKSAPVLPKDNKQGGTITMAVRTIDVVVDELNESREALTLLEKDSANGKIKFNAKVKMANKLSKDIAVLSDELKALHLAEHEARQASAVLSPRDEWASRATILGTENAANRSFEKEVRNHAYALVREGVRCFKDTLLAGLSKHRMVVHEVVPFVRPDRNNRIGHVIFEVPTGAMQVKHWNGQQIEWLAMENYDYNGFAPSRRRLLYGSGFIKLAIRENEHGPYISWPRERGSDGRWWDVFKTSDVRFNIFHSDNNHNVVAALTAFLLTYWGELKKADPRNRFGFNEHCGNCRHMVYLPVHDGMGDEYLNKANPIDTSELGQYGSKMPQWICGVHKDFTDEIAIDELNDAASFEVRSYVDRETQQLRFLRPHEVLVKGVPVSTYEVRAKGTAERCGECPLYAKNEKKPDKTLAREKEASMGAYVPAYWTERAQANRQPVFTRHMVGNQSEWSLGFPGEFEYPVEFMVQGIGGVEIYGAPAREVATEGGDVHTIPALCDSMKANFVPTTEAYRAVDAQVAKLVNIIHSVCNNFATTTQDQLNALVEMISTTKREGAAPLLSRLDRALVRLNETIADHQ
jgi:hypothetical protein